MLSESIGCRVGARSVGRDGAVVDDATSLRGLSAHDTNSLLSAEERSGEVDGDDAVEVGEGDLVDGNVGGASSSVL